MFMIYLKWKENQHALGTYINNNYKIVIKSKGTTEFKTADKERRIHADEKISFFKV